ncbi:MAG TPA: hypothetical protein VK548_10245 [Candidatus Acidoferrum sp.]|nr:hypothetical protein [Candidatus Acidoferrum sp.]
MKRPRALCLVVFLTTVLVVPSRIGLAAVVDPFPVCIGLKAAGLGSPRIDLTLTASPAGPVFQLTGEARFSQAIAPPNGLVVYAVSGTAIPNADGFWVSLTGAGYDLAKSVFHGTFAIQLSADPAKNTLAYAKRSLDGTTTSVVTGAAEVVSCP